jgi:membrane protease YdiL (CAAX protease family)
MDPLVLATVFATGDLGCLAQAKALLDGAGIPYLALGEGRNTLLAEGRLGAGGRAEPLELQVRTGQWARAGALLAEAGLEPVEITPEDQGVATQEEGGTEPAAPAERPGRALSADRLRRWELPLVLLVAFSSTLLASTQHWWIGQPGAGKPTILGSIDWMQRQGIALGLLAYVLARRGSSFRDLGLTFAWVDLPAAFLLLIAGSLARSVAWKAMDWASVAVTGHLTQNFYSPPTFAGWAGVVSGLLLVGTSPLFEEMIARAYTQTEVEALTGSAALAVFASVAVQTSYHFYLGTEYALAAAAAFLVRACFYARFRRITPVILAHMIWNAHLLLNRP